MTLLLENVTNQSSSSLWCGHLINLDSHTFPFSEPTDIHFINPLNSTVSQEIVVASLPEQFLANLVEMWLKVVNLVEMWLKVLFLNLLPLITSRWKRVSRKNQFEEKYTKIISNLANLHLTSLFTLKN